ncbi:adenosylcobalamin-dependent ribonucleoside-diphosphate reductase [Candidatus Dojkabacteria bacterium]|nr:adenosylcobalamin-dependent ribonucleoside-diphosphate reductase [Candidatus Dojkabacteria bacterium]
MKIGKYNLPACYTENSIQLLESRFLKTDKEGHPIETPHDLFERVAKWVSSADLIYTKSETQLKKTEKEFYDILYNLLFIPNSPTLLNAGKKNKTLSACFVLPIEDSLDSIYKTLSDAVQVQWKGGGTGFNFSAIRPKGDQAGGIPDVAAGPCHFIKTFSEALMGIRQGGKRGGANIAILNVDHPDILEFIHLKERDRTIMNFNISVGITDKFMKALQNDEEYDLINPRTKRNVKKLNARYIFNEIIELAHKTGDPGVAFLDNLEKDNPTPSIGTINATNPCGEQPLLPYESCNLGALNLRTHFDFKGKDINWKKLKETIRTAVHFLDNIIDINYYPLEEIKKTTRFTNRKIGMGLMGFADVLILKGISYSSDAAIEYAKKIMSFIRKEGIKASISLAKKRGTFPAYKGSKWEEKKLPVRNATITTIAPNGNTSIIGGSTGGIEPVYALAFKIGGIEDKNYRATKIMFNVNQAFKYIAEQKGFYSEELLEELANNKPILQIQEVPDKYKRIFITAHEIEPMMHLKMQAAFQEHVDNAISKTINFSNEASVEDVRRVFIEAYRNKVKGITIFRDGCKDSQTYVSTQKSNLNVKVKPKEQVKLHIASKDENKIGDIKEFFKQYNGSYVLDTISDQVKLNETIRNKTTQRGLIKEVELAAKKIGSEKSSMVIVDAIGFIYNKPRFIRKNDQILHFGLQDEYSSKLYKKILKFSKEDGSKAYISCAIAIYDPSTQNTISSITKIPGKLIKTGQKRYKYIFVHEGLNIFTKSPSEEDFKSFNPRYKALQKVLEKLSTYKAKSIEVNLTKNAYKVLEKRALKKNSEEKVIETPRELFMRIAEYISSAAKNYGYTESEIEESKIKFFNALKNLEFQCGGALIWAGMAGNEGKNAIWSKCFVLPIEDSIKGIFNTLNDNIEVLRHGGGTGFNFSHLRSTYAKVKSTGEHAAGPVEYLKVYNRAQDTVIGRGGRQMGSMAILNVDHPDITKFIKAKDHDSELTHYNISVGITEEFMQAVKNDRKWELIDPHDKLVKEKVKARELFDLISKHAWQSGDPGLIFLDHIKKGNPTPHLGEIEATNPCGEQPLLPFESCNLGNINLSKIVDGFPYLEKPDFFRSKLSQKLKHINWEKFEYLIQVGIEFLDNVIDINNYPIKEIERATKATRSIGLGLMGFADLLIKLGVSYSSKDAIIIAEKVMHFLNDKSHLFSQHLAKKRGNFPEFKGSVWDKIGIKNMRNSRCTTIAPTGTISIVANCNPGIEPLFALVFKRMNSLGGEEQTVVENLFERVARQRGFYSNDLMNSLSEGKKLSENKNIPEDVLEIFKTSHEIDPGIHVLIQAAFQKHCDSGVSKTINLQKSATVDNVKRIYQQAYESGCKGITIFREGCKDEAQKAGLTKTVAGEEKVLEEPRPRPITTRGVTTQVKTDQGSLYVTINEDSKGISEVFLNIGKSGGYSSGYCEAIGRLVSVSLRAGLSLESIIDQLKGIRTSAPTLNKGMFVYSVPDAIAKVLENYKKEREGKISMFKENQKLEVKSEKDISENQTNHVSDSKVVTSNTHDAPTKETAKAEDDHASHYVKENHYDMLPECPDCGGDLQYAEGCMMCQSCGYSKCG